MDPLTPAATRQHLPLDLLCSPISYEPLTFEDDALVTRSGSRYAATATGIPLFAAHHCSDDAKRQAAHYDKIARAYLANLAYPHTQEYMAYLDSAFLEISGDAGMNTVAEICCGRGEAFHLLGSRVGTGVGIDVSVEMLESAIREHAGRPITFAQGDATMLPLKNGSIESVFMLGGIHHVRDRRALFKEIERILIPGGRFYWREPVSDFFLWRWIRSIIYRASPLLDADTERPLLFSETEPVLRATGLRLLQWKTYGFLGFCLFMNSDVLVFNRVFRYIPGIRAITRLSTRIDDWITSLPGLGRSGLQVIGVAEKSGSSG